MTDELAARVGRMLSNVADAITELSEALMGVGAAEEPQDDAWDGAVVEPEPKKKWESLEGKEFDFTENGNSRRVMVVKDETTKEEYRFTLRALETLKHEGVEHRIGDNFDVVRDRFDGEKTKWRLRTGGALGTIVA